MSLRDDIQAIFPAADKVSVTGSGTTFDVTVGAMYEAPALAFKQLRQLSELFGTEHINVDHYDFEGCETCDFGSDYGHTINLRDVTRRADELAALVGGAA